MEGAGSGVALQKSLNGSSRRNYYYAAVVWSLSMQRRTRSLARCRWEDSWCGGAVRGLARCRTASAACAGAHRRSEEAECQRD